MVSEQVAADPMAHVQQPTEAEVERFARKLQKERDWSTLLPGLARLSLEQDEGLTYSLRIVKQGEADGVRIVKPGEAGAEDAMMALKYNELDRYPFYLSASKGGAQNLADQTGLTPYELRAIIHLLGIRGDDASFKVFAMGSQSHARYSHKALKAIREARDSGLVAEAKEAHRAHDRKQKEEAKS